MRTRRLGILTIFVLAVTILPASSAQASTSITSNITTNTTWTLEGSPYIINRATLVVNAGATLSIEPGVEVQFNKGWTSAMVIEGTLLAIGTESARIQFEPAALQERWYYLKFASSSSGTLDYVDIRDSGGLASTAPWAYGALRMNSTQGVSLWHSHIYRNNNSGILAGSTADLDIQYSDIEINDYGISVVGGAITMTHSLVRQNDIGIYFSHATTPAVQSAITLSDIRNNDGWGVRMNEVPTIPEEKYPTATFSNIIFNNPDGPWTNTEQVHLLNRRWDAYPLWEDNYWGQTVIGTLCPFAPWPGHLTFIESLDGAGPIDSTEYAGVDPQGEPDTCEGDDLQVVGYSTIEIPTGAPEYPI